MSGITVLSAKSALEQAMVDLYGRSMTVRRAWSETWRDPTEVAIGTCADDPDLVVIGSDVRHEQVLAILEALRAQFPETTVLCLVAARDPAYSMRLLQHGARDVIVEKEAGDEFRSEIDPVLRIARSRRSGASTDSSGGHRRVIAIISPKGGTGKTTVSTNLATVLANRVPTEVVLLDLDIQFGDCAPALGITPEHSLLDAIEALEHRPSTLKAVLSDHTSGLLVLAPPDDLVQAEQIEPEQIDRVLVSAAQEFPLVVIDTASGIDAASLSAIEQATDLLLVSTPDAPSVRATRRQLDTLDQLGYTNQRRTLVLNRSNAKGGLPVAEVESTLGLEVAFQIPSTRLIVTATNEGVPVVQRSATSAAARGFESLGALFVPDEGEGGDGGGSGSGRRSRLRPRRFGR